MEHPKELLPSETELSDDYPVYPDYIYIIEKDERLFFIKSNIRGTVLEIKKDTNAEKVYKFDFSRTFK